MKNCNKTFFKISRTGFNIVLQLIIINCSIAQNPRIFGGKEVGIEKYPWQVSIEASIDNIHFCGGSILNEEWIITSAHCVYTLDPEDILIHAGASDQTDLNAGQLLEVDDVILHSSYHYLTNENDIALLHLSTPLCFNENVQPIQYATLENISDYQDVGSPAVISGWGYSENSSVVSDILRAADIHVYSSTSAQMNLAACNINSPPVLSSMIAFKDHDVSAGPGDSGGPAIIYNEDGIPLLIGLTSWGCAHDHSDYPSIYTRVTSFTDFIEDNEVFFNDACSLFCEDDRDIYDEIEYNTNFSINGDVIIHNEAVLTITSRIRFAQGHGIIVEQGGKLIVDGGQLTKCSEGDSWRGINVYGDSGGNQPTSPNNLPSSGGPAMVVMKNGAKVDYAQTAISTTKYGEHWNSEYWGAYIYCEETEFSNCTTGVEFMKYSHENNSEFVDCNFLNGKFGVTIWSTDVIEFDNCTFENLEKVGLLVWDAGAKVKNGCEFRGNGVGIQSNATSTISSGAVLNIDASGGSTNIFEDNTDYSIELRTNDLYKNTRIINNSFLGSDIGIWLDGKNSVKIINNYFNGTEWGVLSEFTDMGLNSIYCNDFTYNVVVPIIYLGNNGRSQFNKNLFDNDLCDVIIAEALYDNIPGTVNKFIGFFGNPAENCFSLVNPENIWTLGETDPFNYFVKRPADLCEQPAESGNTSNSTDNYTLRATDESRLEDCELLGEEGDDDFTTEDYDDLKSSYTTLSTRFISSPTNLELNDSLLMKEEEKYNVISWFMRDAILNNNSTDAEYILDEENNYSADRLEYSLMLKLGNYIKAADILDGISTSNQDRSWFKDIQEINLEFLTDPSEFELNETDEGLLEEVASSQSSERGIARSLLSLFDYTSFSHDFSLSRGFISGNLDQSKLNTVLIFPNPASESIEIILPNNFLCSSIVLSTLNGQILPSYYKIIANVVNLSLENIPSGMYFIEVYNQQKKCFRSKLIVQK